MLTGKNINDFISQSPNTSTTCTVVTSAATNAQSFVRFMLHSKSIVSFKALPASPSVECAYIQCHTTVSCMCTNTRSSTCMCIACSRTVIVASLSTVVVIVRCYGRSIRVEFFNKDAALFVPQLSTTIKDYKQRFVLLYTPHHTTHSTHQLL